MHIPNRNEIRGATSWEVGNVDEWSMSDDDIDDDDDDGDGDDGDAHGNAIDEANDDDEDSTFDLMPDPKFFPFSVVAWNIQTTFCVLGVPSTLYYYLLIAFCFSTQLRVSSFF